MADQKRTVRNTSKEVAENPAQELLRMVVLGTDTAITSQEAAGQRQLVNSDVLPTNILFGTQEEFETLGFVFGDIVEGDEIFRYVQLPTGWSKRGSDHDMWSTIVDANGEKAVAVFYKAAFYDRSAHMQLVGEYVDRRP